MGEHPPLLTPQGPGASRARRPGFPRVDDSDTSRVSLSFPDSWWIAPPFAASASSPASRRFFSRPDTGSSTGLPALVALVFPSVSFPFLASGLLHLVPHFRDPGSFSSPYARVSLQLLSRSPLPCVRFLRFRRRLLSRPQTFQLFPDLLSNLGSTAPALGLGFVARESRRSALTPLPRSGKKHRVVTGT